MLNTIVTGIGIGGIYALLALAIVMINQGTGTINFAQGEMATFGAFLAWQFLTLGAGYWVAFAATVAVALVGGAALGAFMLRLLRRTSPLGELAATIGLFAIFNSLGGFFWGHLPKPFPSPFGAGRPFGLVSAHDVGLIAVLAVLLVGLTLFFRLTTAGLAMRAAADNPVSARLSGIGAGRVAALAWGMAAALGAVAGMLVAPSLLLEPNMMLGVFPYALAGAVIGGLASPLGAVVGGLAVGLFETLIGAFVPVYGQEMKLTLAMAAVIAALVLRPGGLIRGRDGARV